MQNFHQLIIRLLTVLTLLNSVMLKPAFAAFPVVDVNSIGPIDEGVVGYVDDDGAEDDEITDADLISCPGCLDPSLVSPLDFKQQAIIDQTNGVLVQQAFKDYSGHEKVVKMIAEARQHIADKPDRYIIRRGGRKKTFCYRAVKDAMCDSGMVPLVFAGSSVARNGVKDLEPLGFRNLLEDPNFKNIMKDDPKMAPKGAILVYETAKGARPSAAGHIEIKTEDSGVNGYISVSETDKPTYGYAIPSQRKLIGVLVK